MKVSITFGVGVDKDGDELSNAFVEAALNAIETRAVNAFGGYTLIDGEGGYVNPNGRLVRECVQILVIHTDKLDIVGSFASDVRRLLNQESVLVSFVESADTFVRS